MQRGCALEDAVVDLIPLNPSYTNLRADPPSLEGRSASKGERSGKSPTRESLPITSYTKLRVVPPGLERGPKWQFTCEIQVRTLMEEVWGEIAHTIDYPVATTSVACKEQLRALARATSSCSRLVDSLVASDEDHRKRESLSRAGRRTKTR